MSASDLNLILKERKNNIPDAGGKIPDLGLALEPSLAWTRPGLDKAWPGQAWPGQAWPGQGLAWTSLAWTGQGCASAARNPKGPQITPFGHQMGRHKRSGRGLDAKFDQNFAPDLSRGVPGVISRLFFDHFLDLKSEKVVFLRKNLVIASRTINRTWKKPKS